MTERDQDAIDLESVRALEQTNGDQSEAARILGIPRQTLRGRIHRAERVANVIPDNDSDKDLDREVFAPFPDDDIEDDELLDHMERRFEQRLSRERAETWFPINEPSNEPTAYTWFGDPHLGNNGCDIKKLREHVKIINDCPGMKCVNLGDTVDGWGGNLLRLYADNDVSRQTERRLARWFLEGSQLPWRVWVLGNHDVMDATFAAYLSAINASRIAMVDWRAKFRVCFPNGVEIRIDCSHDHKGSSIYWPLHGQKRTSLWEGRENADIYIAGHRHNWALATEEVAKGKVIHMARARGYKAIDDFAKHRNYVQQEYGQSIVTIFDPVKSPDRRVQMFSDVEAGADYLTWLRSRS